MDLDPAVLVPVKKWSKPPLGWVKLSCDGSVKTEDGTTRDGMVLRDETGSVIFCACHLLACDDPLEAEARACEEGLRLALEQSNKPIIMESDCYSLLSVGQTKTMDRSNLMHLMEEIKSLVKGSRDISFVKVDRSEVRVSHCLANFAIAEARSDVWFASGPECVAQVLELDLLVTQAD
jgi:ribonuclease HI